MKNIFFAALHLFLGTVLAVTVFEVALRANPSLLLRGMALPAPVDPPLTRRVYDVHYSDADAFVWRPDLIRPVKPEEDRLEAHVEYVTDELGFRNQPPLPEKTDVVVMGRSISLAAHLPAPWPALLSDLSNKNVLNLSQPGSGLSTKMEYLDRYGFPRHPRWVIVEVVPSIDFFDDGSPPALLSQRLVYPAIQSIWWQVESKPPEVSPRQMIYPLEVDLPGRTLPLTCCLHYLDFFTLDRDMLEKSLAWANYQRELRKLIDAAKAHNACVALLYAPTKPDLYFPLAVHPYQLEQTLREIAPLQVNSSGEILLSREGKATAELVRRNAFSGRDLLRDFAAQNSLPLIDPTDHMVQLVLNGVDPFMQYDSHWNEAGHEIVAQAAYQTLHEASCP